MRPGRKAIALAGDDPADVATVAALVDAWASTRSRRVPLADGVRLEPGTEPFGANVEAEALRAMVDRQRLAGQASPRSAASGWPAACQTGLTASASTGACQTPEASCTRE